MDVHLFISSSAGLVSALPPGTTISIFGDVVPMQYNVREVVYRSRKLDPTTPLRGTFSYKVMMGLHTAYMLLDTDEELCLHYFQIRPGTRRR